MGKEKLVIIGAGGLGREIVFLLSDINGRNNCFDISGFIDDTPGLQDKIINGVPVLGNSSWLLNYNENINVVIAVGSSQARKNIYERFSNKKNICFPNIIADNSKCSDTVVIGKGCIIGYNSTLLANITLGDFVLLNHYCAIGHDVCIGDFVTLYGNVSVSGNVTIDSCAEIGAGVRIMQKKSIGENSKVGIGSVVVNNVPADCTVFGVPAKKIL
jgi:sugar O-acyltransferase (sialic acid O-acetyltransferase NeuD family)